jgi:hypothetical protein
MYYKVLRRRKDGTLGSLFVDGSRRIRVGVWEQAWSDMNPSWLKFLPGWHTHTSLESAKKLASVQPNRVIFEVELRQYLPTLRECVDPAFHEQNVIPITGRGTAIAWWMRLGKEIT